MNYRPKHLRLPKGGVLNANKAKDIAPYVFTDAIAIAVDVALATDRPLLVLGNPGCGKSRLADAVAAAQGWNLLARTVTSRTRLETLTAEVDQLRRLHDAQVRAGQDTLKPDAYYLNPGLLWWAFDADSAARRGLAPEDAEKHQAQLGYPGTRRTPPRRQPPGTVLLIDEIDKAEPDLPNDLLEPLDRRRFALPDGFSAHHPDGPRNQVQAPPPEALRLLTLITSNGERAMPDAFLRRCVVLEIEDPDEDALVEIARKHYPEGDPERMRALAQMLLVFRTKARDLRVRPPGTAELLDAVAACETLGVEVDTDKGSVWSHLERAILAKDRELRG